MQLFRPKTAIVGKRGSCKAELRKAYQKRGFMPSIQYTDRPPKPDERGGVDYWFVPASTFHHMNTSKLFMEQSEHGGYRYGTLLRDIDCKDIFILSPQGLKDMTYLRNYFFVIYLDIPYATRIENLERIGVDNFAAHNIVKQDDADFSSFIDYDMRVTSIGF